MEKLKVTIENLDNEFTKYKAMLESLYTMEYSNILREKILAFQASSTRLDLPAMIAIEFTYAQKLEEARQRRNNNIEQEQFRYVSARMKMIRNFDENYYLKEIDRAFAVQGPLSMFAYRV